MKDSRQAVGTQGESAILNSCPEAQSVEYAPLSNRGLPPSWAAAGRNLKDTSTIPLRYHAQSTNQRQGRVGLLGLPPFQTILS